MRDAVSLRPPYLRGFNHIGYVKVGEESYPCQIFDMSSTSATLFFKNRIELPDRFTVHLGLGMWEKLQRAAC
jgi:hypothetical protein